MSDARILDRGYRRYDGERSGRSGAVRSVAWHTTRSILGLGRPARHKVFPVIVIVIAFLPAIAFLGLSILIGDFGEGELRPDYWELFDLSRIPAVLFASMVAPEAIVRDRRDGMFALYLSTPLTRRTYLVAKVAAVLGCLSIITIGPPTLLLLGYTVQSQGPGGVLEWLGVGGRLVVAGIAIAAVLSAIGLAAASLTDRRAFASVAAIMVLIGGLIAGGSLVEGAGLARELWLVSPVDCVVELAPRLFGDESFSLRGVSTGLVVLGSAGWLFLGAGVVAWRYRKLAAV